MARNADIAPCPSPLIDSRLTIRLGGDRSQRPALRKCPDTGDPSTTQAYAMPS
jgi:hypothetical protein